MEHSRYKQLPNIDGLYKYLESVSDICDAFEDGNTFKIALFKTDWNLFIVWS